MLDYNDRYIADIQKTIDSNDMIREIFGKRVFITGVNGLICSAVVDLLHVLNRKYHAEIDILLAGRDKERVRNRFYYMKEGADYCFVPFVLSQEFKMDLNFDYYIHGASRADPQSIMSDPVDVILANIIGVNSLLDHIARKGKGRLLYISSSEVYGQKTDRTEAFREEDYGFLDILNPRACYPGAKRTAETLCVSYLDRNDTDVVIARPGHIYGPTITDGDSRATAEFTRYARSGSDIVMKSKGTQLRSYCYVLDCVSALLIILLHGEKGCAYNISNPDSVVTIAQIAQRIADSAGVDLVFESATEEEMKSYNLMDNSSLDASRLLRLGWKPVFSMKNGVDSTMCCYKER